MIELILTIICSTSIAIILKINSSNGGDSILLLTGNYLSASIISFILFISYQNPTAPLELVPLGIFLALLFVGSIFSFSKSVSLSGAAISTVSSRLSVIVPFFLSIIFYSEIPSSFQILGLILTLLTIVLFYFSIKKNSETSNRNIVFTYLILILLGIGMADFFMKVFQENYSTSDKPWFLFWIFFFSFLITLFISLKQKKVFNKKPVFLGMVMGVPNIFSSYFLIEALKTFPAIIIYPIVNISIIIFTAIIVKIFWNELWNKFSLLALLTGLLSILFLSI